MTDRIPASLLADRAKSAKKSKKPPTAGRILAASLSVASGIGLVGLLGASKQPAEVIVQVAPTPVVIERTAATPSATATDLFVVQSAEPVPVQAIQQPEPVQADTQSEGS